jgi:KDO2-lipid IV(A) lauroyltransferase
VGIKTRRAFRSRLIYLCLIGISAVVRRLPLRLVRFLGLLTGHLGWHVLRRERRRAMGNITRAFPEWSVRGRARAVRGMFHHLGQSLFEVLWMENLDDAAIERTTTFENMEPILELVRAGRGIVAFTGHCGNWEWMAYCLTKRGIPMSVLQRERNEAQLNQLITRIRATAGIRTIDRGSTGAARELIFALRRGGMLGFLIDQSIRAEGVKVPFFGQPALTPIGPAKLAIRSSAPVVSVFVERRNGKHHVRFNDVIETKDNDDPVALTALITQEIEEAIRRAPEQWVWMHDRWRERPKWEVESKTSNGKRQTSNAPHAL